MSSTDKQNQSEHLLKPLLNKTEAADLLGVSRRTIHEWRKVGYGPKWHKLPGGREVTTLKACELFVEKLSEQD